MHSTYLVGALTGAALAASLAAQAYPLPLSAGDTTASEGTAPFLVPTRMQQTPVTNYVTLRGLGLPASFTNWDMSAFDSTSRYVFIPAEVGAGAGVFRYDTVTKTFLTQLQGNGTGVRQANPAVWNPASDDYARLDPATYTPWGSVITGEETTGGRLFEIMNAAGAGPHTVLWRSNIPAVAHEGLQFDSDGTLYFVDENNSGCYYKFVPAAPGDLSVGQSYVLRVDAYAAYPTANPAANWDDTSNRPAPRTGPATWVPMTDAAGVPLTVANPFVFVTTTGGRTAADELRGTPYGRPEDLTIGRLVSNNECVYVTATSENTVYSIELVDATHAIVRQFVNFNSINLATGADVNLLQNTPYESPGPGTNFDSPDNLEIDLFGSVYIIEDNQPGDIWKAVDTNNNGVAEGIGLFVSLGVDGAEPTGLLADPNDPYRLLVNIQHPASGNDALWAFSTRPYRGSGGDLLLQTGVNRAPSSGPGEFVRDAGAGDVLSYNLVSPFGQFLFAPYLLLLQANTNANGPVSVLPGLWLNLGQPIAVLGTTIGTFPLVLPPSGTQVAILIPPGVAGYSIVAQGVATNGGPLTFTDAHETILHQPARSRDVPTRPSAAWLARGLGPAPLGFASGALRRASRVSRLAACASCLASLLPRRESPGMRPQPTSRRSCRPSTPSASQHPLPGAQDRSRVGAFTSPGAAPMRGAAGRPRVPGFPSPRAAGYHAPPPATGKPPGRGTRCREESVRASSAAPRRPRQYRPTLPFKRKREPTS